MRCYNCRNGKKDETAVNVLKLGPVYQAICSECDARGARLQTEQGAKVAWGKVLQRILRTELSKQSLTEREKNVYAILQEARRYKRPRPTTVELSKVTGYHSNSILRYINSLQIKKWIRLVGVNSRTIEFL